MRSLWCCRKQHPVRVTRESDPEGRVPVSLNHGHPVLCFMSGVRSYCKEVLGEVARTAGVLVAERGRALRFKCVQ